jgi:DNA primase
MVSVHYQFYPQFRTALSIREIEDPAAKELFVALEECFINDESGMDELLSRIQDSALRAFITSRGNLPMFQVNPGRFIADGIKKVKQKRLKEKLDEIVKRIRITKNVMSTATGGGDQAGIQLEELLAEKMHIDIELRQLKEVKQ